MPLLIHGLPLTRALTLALNLTLTLTRRPLGCVHRHASRCASTGLGSAATSRCVTSRTSRLTLTLTLTLPLHRHRSPLTAHLSPFTLTAHHSPLTLTLTLTLTPTLGPEELGELGEARGGRPEGRGQEGVAPLVQELERQAQRLS